MKISEEDVQLLNELYDKYNKGLRIKSEVLTDLYNRVTGNNVTNTTCGSCLRLRLFEMVNILNKIKKEYGKKLSKEDRDFLIWALGLEQDHFPSFSKVVDIYNKVFDTNEVESNCLTCLKRMLNNLYEVL